MQRWVSDNYNVQNCFYDLLLLTGIHLHKKQTHSTSGNKKSQKGRGKKEHHIKKSISTPTHLAGKGESDDEKELDSYQTVAVQVVKVC